MNLVERVKGILLKPKEEWVKIKAEKTSIAQLFMGYAVLLAAIPAIANFIGLALVGYHMPVLGSFRWPLGRTLIYCVVLYALSLIFTYGLGFIINVLAPSFESKANAENAMKLAVYSMTVSWLIGIFNVIPSSTLRLLIGLVSFYGLYILYLGFSNPLMDTPKDKAVGYMIVSGVIAIVFYVLTSIIAGVFLYAGGGFRGL